MDVTTDRIAKLPPEQQAIRAKCFHPTGTLVEFTKEEVEQSIPERFEKIVQMYPNRLAVTFKDSSFTYDGLNDAANRLAHALVGSAGTKEEPIALLLEPNSNYLVAMLGVLKAGKFCVHIDPANPRERQSFILRHSGAQLVITNNNYLALGESTIAPECRLVNIDTLDSSLSCENLELHISPDLPAKISYTSGSTGEPKGVIQSHRYVMHKVVIDKLFITGEDRLAQIGKISSEVFNVLLNGAAFFSWDVKKEGFAQLADWLITHRISVYRSVPTVFRHFCTQLETSRQISAIRKIILGGEPVYKHDVELFRRHFASECVLINKFGGAEAGSISYYVVNKQTEMTDDILPIGYSFPGKEVILLNDSTLESRVDSFGEIAVKSRYLSPGYLGRDDLTQTAFSVDTADENIRIYRTGDIGSMRSDGCLVYRGRQDARVKVRGNKVEIADIEAAIFDHKGIKEAVVIAKTDKTKDTSLIAYYVPAQDPPPSGIEIRSWLERKLPDYMIPSTFIRLEKLPVLLSGKVDRRALPDPGNTRPELTTMFVTPVTPVEMELATIWAEVLCLDRVGIHDSFFDLGGHSLAATRVVSRVIKKFQLELPLQSLFQSPTVAEMAVVITENQAKKLSDSDLDRVLSELESMSDEEAVQTLALTTAERDSANG